jgi:hypothetical protein
MVTAAGGGGGGGSGRSSGGVKPRLGNDCGARLATWLAGLVAGGGVLGGESSDEPDHSVWGSEGEAPV